MKHLYLQHKDGLDSSPDASSVLNVKKSKAEVNLVIAVQWLTHNKNPCLKSVWVEKYASCQNPLA